MAFRIFGIEIPARTRPEPPAEQRSMWTLPGGFGVGYPMGGPSAGLEQALCNSASYACMDVLVDHISAAPWDAVKDVRNGHETIKPRPKLLRDPSETVTADVWRAQMAFALVTDGNAFGQILNYDRYVKPSQVEWLDPSKITKRDVVGGIPQVEIENRVHRLYPFGDILHIPGRMITPASPFALSPVEYADKTIGTSLAAQDFTSSWFSGGGHPSVEIIVEGLSTVEQAMGVKANHQAMVRTGEPWVHGDGIESKESQPIPDLSAITGAMQQAAIMACQIWHVPPSWIYIAMSGQNVTYANVAQADVAGLKDSVDVYWRRAEGVMTRCLPEEQVMRVNRDATLRTDAMTRVQVQQLRLANKLMSVNEGRTQEDERPWDDPIYDEPGLPSAPAPVEEQPMSNGPGGNGDEPSTAPANGSNARRSTFTVPPRVVEATSKT